MISIPQEQLSAITAAAKASKDGVKRALNPANPTDLAAIRAFLGLMGKTPTTHPALYDDIAKLAQSGGQPADNPMQALNIVDSGRDPQGRATARAWHQDREGGLMSGSLALVLDATSHKPLALGFANKVGGGLTPAATRAESAQPATGSITTLGFYHSQAKAEAAPKFGMVSQTTTLAVTAVLPSINDPKIKVSGHTSIVIGLGRSTWNNTDVDYYYSQDGASGAPLIVPFTGTVDVQQPLANLDNTHHFTSGLTLTTQLYSTTGQSFINLYPNQTLPSFVTGSGSVVTWNFPYVSTQNPLGTPPPAGTPLGLVYNFASSADNTLTAFFFQFVIPVNNIANPSVTTSVCSTDWPEPHSGNCTPISDITFWFHCLAKGTKITLADGSTLPIEEIDNAKRVRTGHGKGTLGVEATTRGPHLVAKTADTALGVYELTTAKGRRLVLTGGHPVATESGLVRAADLKPGIALHAEDGSDEVKSCHTIVDDGMFYNLKLIDASDRANGLAAAVGTFVANGLVVGDFASMTKTHYNNTHSLDYMKARLPSRLHKDYESTLNHIARDNSRYGGNF